MKAPPDAVYAAIRDGDPDVMDRDELAAMTRQIAEIRTWLDARQVRVNRCIRALAEQGRAESPKDLLIREGGQSGRDAHTEQARERTCSLIPAIDDALADGAITGAQVDAIARATSTMDQQGAAELASHADALIDRAGQLSVDAFGREVQQLANWIAANQGSDTEVLERQRRQSKVSRWVDRGTGMHYTKIALDPVRDAELHRGLQRHIKGAKRRPGGDKLSFDQLQAQAVVDAITTASDTNSKVVQLIVLVDEQTLRDGLHEQGVCETSDGTPVPVSLVRQIACDAEIIPVVLNGAGVAVDVGRASRLATESQRQAIRAMYATCTFPGCTICVDDCEIHHLQSWERGGRTDLANLAPLCLANGHHHLIHDQGWTITIDPATREITITRPDGVTNYQGPSLNRQHPAA